MAEIWAHIAAQASELVATNFLGALQAQYETLIRFPESGAPREHLAPGLRVQLFKGYASYYRAENQTVIIIRVLNGHRDVSAMASEGGLEV